ncbi:uncharacterized protein [Diadema antillarum]|uniref:uncharacterized protein n=1 Tax=Diadema antillarum TaxID=105358 RepID=UPI003A881692
MTTTNSDISPQTKLLSQLLDNYGPRSVRPVRERSDIVDISFRLLPRELIKFDEGQQTVQISASVRMIWRDEKMTWDPEEFGGVDIVMVKGPDVWLPDIALYENVVKDFISYSDTYIHVSSNGSMDWYVLVVMTAACPVDITYFPYDVQKCHMQIGPWTLAANQVDFHISTEADSTYIAFQQNGVWSLEKTLSENGFYNRSRNYPIIRYTLCLRRESGFYTRTIIVPSIFLTSLMALGCWLHPASGEKVTLAVSNLLALILFQQLVSDRMPPSGKSTSILVNFFITMIALSCTEVLCAIIVLRVHHMGGHHPLPSWVRRWMLRPFIRRLYGNERCLVTIGIHHQQSVISDVTSKIGRSETTESIGEQVNTRYVATRKGCSRSWDIRDPNELREASDDFPEVTALTWREAAIVCDKILFTLLLVAIVVAWLAKLSPVLVSMICQLQRMYFKIHLAGSVVQFFLLIAAQLAVTHALSYNQSVQNKLSTMLLDNYGPTSDRPVNDANEPTDVTFRFLTRELIKFDESLQQLKLSASVRMRWRDEKMTWVPEDYGGIDLVTVRQEDIWEPDIMLYENVVKDFMSIGRTFLLARSNGEIDWYFPAILTAACTMNITYFPYDTQKCHLTFGPWSLTTDLINFTHALEDFNPFRRNGVWSLEKTLVEDRIVHSCCDNRTWSSIRYTLYIHRESGFYTHTIIIPSVLLTTLLVLVCWLHPASGEKVTLAVSNLLALILFQQLVADRMPPSGETTSIMVNFFVMMIGLSCAEVLTATLVLRVYHHGGRSRLPGWVARIMRYRLIVPLYARVHYVNANAGAKKEPECVAPSFDNHVICTKKSSHPKGGEANTTDEPIKQKTLTPAAQPSIFRPATDDRCDQEEIIAMTWRETALVFDKLLSALLMLVTLGSWLYVVFCFILKSTTDE